MSARAGVAASEAHWLSWRTGIGLGAAREKLRVARALQQLPRIGEAMRRGELSFAKVRAITRVARPDSEEQLLELARHGTASHIERIVRAWRRVDWLEEQYNEHERHRKRELTLYVDDDGMYVLRGRLDPEVGAVLGRALAAASEALYGRRGPEDARARKCAADGIEPATVTQRRADAIGLIAECALRSELAAPKRVIDEELASEGASRVGDGEVAEDRVDLPALESDRSTVGSQHAQCSRTGSRRRTTTGGRADRFQVVVHVDADALRESSDSGQSVLDGERVSAETSRRLACDASRVIMVHDAEGETVSVGRRTRTVPPAIRRALEHRDRGCRFPGCGLRFCDARHVKH